MTHVESDIKLPAFIGPYGATIIMATNIHWYMTSSQHKLTFNEAEQFFLGHKRFEIVTVSWQKLHFDAIKIFVINKSMEIPYKIRKNKTNPLN